MEYKIKKIAGNLKLGEGCIWDAARNKVHYLDIEGFNIYSYSLETKKIETMDMGDYVGCIVLDDTNNLVAAVRNRLIHINLETNEKKTLLTIQQPQTLRFNDGKCDKHGNLLV